MRRAKKKKTPPGSLARTPSPLGLATARARTRNGSPASSATYTNSGTISRCLERRGGGKGQEKHTRGRTTTSAELQKAFGRLHLMSPPSSHLARSSASPPLPSRATTAVRSGPGECMCAPPKKKQVALKSWVRSRRTKRGSSTSFQVARPFPLAM